MSVKKWDRWQKISRDDLKDGAFQREKKIAPFVVGKDKRFSSKEVVGGTLLKDKPPPPFEKLTEVVLSCECCGISIPSNDFFYFFHPSKRLICRGCRQNNKKCANCRDVVSPNLFFPDLPYCQDCKKRGVCDSCGKETPSNDLTRIAKIKGCYCESCAKRSKSCLHCFRKVSQNSSAPVCHSCASKEIHTREEIVALVEDVVGFYRNLDPSFYIPFRSKSLRVVELKDIASNPGLLEKPILIANGSVSVLKTIKEINIYRHLSYDLSQAHVQYLNLFDENKSMRKTVVTFLSFLFFDQKKLVSPIEDVQELGLLQGSSFSFFKDAYEKLGLKEVYQRIKKGASHGRS